MCSAYQNALLMCSGYQNILLMCSASYQNVYKIDPGLNSRNKHLTIPFSRPYTADGLCRRALGSWEWLLHNSRPVGYTISDRYVYITLMMCKENNITHWIVYIQHHAHLSLQKIAYNVTHAKKLMLNVQHHLYSYNISRNLHVTLKKNTYQERYRWYQIGQTSKWLKS